MPPSEAAEHIQDSAGAIVDAFAEAATLRNYTGGSRDKQGDPAKQLTTDSPHSVDAHFEIDATSGESSRPEGERTTSDATVFITTDVDVYDEDDAHPYPSEVERDGTGEVFRVVAAIKQPTGFWNLDAVRIDAP